MECGKTSSSRSPPRHSTKTALRSPVTCIAKPTRRFSKSGFLYLETEESTLMLWRSLSSLSFYDFPDNLGSSLLSFFGQLLPMYMIFRFMITCQGILNFPPKSIPPKLFTMRKAAPPSTIVFTQTHRMLTRHLILFPFLDPMQAITKFYQFYHQITKLDLKFIFPYPLSQS